MLIENERASSLVCEGIPAAQRLRVCELRAYDPIAVKIDVPIHPSGLGGRIATSEASYEIYRIKSSSVETSVHDSLRSAEANNTPALLEIGDKITILHLPHLARMVDECPHVTKPNQGVG